MYRAAIVTSTLRQRIGAAVVTIALALVASSCSSGDQSSTTTTRSSDTSTAEPSSTTSTAPLTDPADLPAPKPFTGTLDEFYEVPEPLPQGQPGQLIRIMPVGEQAGQVVVRVMYHSRDVRDRDRAVTGTISYPTAEAPEGGWPVVSWAHGTTGLAQQCAPSRFGAPGRSFGVEGVIAATDYIGLGPDGERHGYLSGTSEAHSVVDAVRAARQLPDAYAGTTWVAAGHSQGGHSALFAHQLGKAYAPELQLKGTAAIAPAAMLTEIYGPADEVIPRMVGLLAMFGWATDYPDLDLDEYLGAQAKARQDVVDSGCLMDIVEQMVTIPPDELYAEDPQSTEPAESIIDENDPGKVKVEAPLLLVYGTADTWVVPDRVKALFARECRIGQATEIVAVAGADHGTVVESDAIGPWLEQRLLGRPAKDGCSSGAAESSSG